MSQTQVKYLKDYQAPLFTIAAIELVFNLAGNETSVQAISQVKRTSSHAEALVLDGEELTIVSLTVDGDAVPYHVTAGQLVLETELDEFELNITTKLDPEANSSLEGLYMSDGAYCTQCEAEGFRRITY
ncbi:MAG: aminopeptidase N, partial [Shewanella sp.]